MTSVADSSARSRRATRSRRRAIVLAGVAAVVALGAGCSGDGGASDITRPDEPLVTLPDNTIEPGPSPTDPPPQPSVPPEQTVAPQPTAPPEQPATTEQPVTAEPIDEGDGTTNGEAAAIGILLLALGAIIGLVVWLSRRSDDRRRTDDSFRRRLASISASTRWVVDQGIPALLGPTDPVTSQSTWTTVNTTLSDVQQQLIAIPRSSDAQSSRALSDLENAVASMRGSIDSGYRVRLEHPGQPEIVGASDRAILAQRDQLMRAIPAFEVATANA